MGFSILSYILSITSLVRLSNMMLEFWLICDASRGKYTDWGIQEDVRAKCEDGGPRWEIWESLKLTNMGHNSHSDCVDTCKWVFYLETHRDPHPDVTISSRIEKKAPTTNVTSICTIRALKPVDRHKLPLTAELHAMLSYRNAPTDFFQAEFIEVVFLMLASQRTIQKALGLARESFGLDFLPCSMASNLTEDNN